MIEYILNPESVEALGWTLLHSIWQGAAFALLLVGILIALRSYSAQSRYVVSVGLLCAFFLTLSGTFWLQWQQANNRFELTAKQSNKQSTNDVFVLNNKTENVLPSDKKGKSVIQNNGEIIVSNQSSWLLEFRNYYERHLPLLVTIWFLGILFLQLRFLGQLAYVQRLKHYGTELFPASWSDKIEELEGKLRIQKKVRYLTSIRVESPMVIGWLKPVVLMPQQLFNSLTETEIYAVLAHELAHIRREDFIVNLMQTFLCNVFFFHPGVWWMSNRIDDEREHCCDDLAVAVTGPATSYAKTLINVSEFQLGMQRNTPLAVAFSGKNKKRERGGFSGRIRRLFSVSNSAGTFREGFATAVILITALFLGLAATGSTVQISDLPTPTEINSDRDDLNAEDLNKEAPNNVELDLSTKIVTTTIVKEDKPISNVSQVVDLIELPIAAPAKSVTPAKPAVPTKPVAPAKPIRFDDTRVDALVMACEEGDFDFVKTLVNSGVNINGVGSEGFTPLMMATSNEEHEIVEYLLRQGADVNQTYNGWTALIEAADEGSLTSMKHLLKAGAEVNFYNGRQSPTALSMAASEGKLECLQLLLDNGANIDGIGKSVPPLHIAANEDKRAIIDHLISKKVSINKKDAAGRTALMYAASEGKLYSVKILVEAGANTSMVDSYGATARDYADEEDEYATRDYLDGVAEDYEHDKVEGEEYQYEKRDYSSADKRPKIHQATQDGLIEKVQRMVELGTDVNTIDEYGRTPLHLAAAKGHDIDMRVLIDLGADINAQDKQGRTPLMYAAADGKGNVAALLVSKVANVNIQDVDGKRAYEWAKSGGNSELAQFFGLITESKTPADIKESLSNRQNQIIQKEEQRSQKEIQKNGQRETIHFSGDGVHLRQFDIEEKNQALLEAARNGSVEDCSVLLNNGHKVNNTDDTGQTALMVAASTNRLDIAKFLIAQGADVNKRSASGLTALHYAALENGDQMARLLLKNKAKVDASMRYSSTDGNYTKEPLVWEYIGATPLLIAVESGNAEVITVLINAGANKNIPIIKKKYKLNKNRATYLSASEVMGLDEDFLKEVELLITDDTWTPYKQALLLNKPEILAFFSK